MTWGETAGSFTSMNEPAHRNRNDHELDQPRSRVKSCKRAIELEEDRV
jgi:hypothetical protein